MAAIEVRKKEGETSSALLYRFTRRVRQSGVLTEARKRQFRRRGKNKRSRRLSALYRAKKRALYQRRKKLGLL